MATIHTHRPSSPARVSLDFDLPASVLVLAPAQVRDFRAAYSNAEAALQAALAEVTTPAEVLADNASAIRSAVMAGRKVPAAVSETEADARARLSVSRVNDAARAAFAAATTYETALIAHRTAIRAALAPAFHEADAEATEARRVAAEKDGQRDSLLSAFTTLDNAAALADDKASAEKTYRHRNALSEARSGAQDADVVATDYLDAEEYRVAEKGQAHHDAVREAQADLRAIRNGDRRFTTYAARGVAEANVVAHLQALGVRA